MGDVDDAGGVSEAEHVGLEVRAQVGAAAARHLVQDAGEGAFQATSFVRENGRTPALDSIEHARPRGYVTVPPVLTG